MCYNGAYLADNEIVNCLVLSACQRDGSGYLSAPSIVAPLAEARKTVSVYPSILVSHPME
jgi:hypothetical protein